MASKDPRLGHGKGGDPRRMEEKGTCPRVTHKVLALVQRGSAPTERTIRSELELQVPAWPEPLLGELAQRLQPASLTVPGAAKGAPAH